MRMKEYKLTYIAPVDNKRHLFKLGFDTDKYSLEDRLSSLSALNFRDIRVYDSNNKLIMKLDKIQSKGERYEAL